MTETAFETICAQAEAYCRAVWTADAAAFEEMCHERFNMTHVGPEGLAYWDKTSFIARVSGRGPFPGPASFGIYGVDISGEEMARVHLWVDVPPLRYEDHLGFVKTGGGWKLLTKVYRTQARLDEQE
jgi:hypothetical protein